ncbi:MAG: NAD(P)-dependent oxidoreductase [Bacteroidales bacterium]|jgi:nucleoside-diphosphate-sugar epimerase|nr:NAD(P)-dependent oxidoreductase [Bacteroidales bacterium]
MKILISGAGGYLGTEIIKQLVKTENKIYALTSNKVKIEERFGSSVIGLSNDELFAEKSFLSEIDIIVHCAFARGHKKGKEIAKSLLFTTNLFDNVAKNEKTGIINISTQEVYGKIQAPWNEIMEAEPVTVYGTVKYFSELYLKKISENSNIAFTNLRLAGLIGVGADTRMVSKFVDSALKGDPIKISNNNLLFSQLDIHDAAAGIIALLNIPFKNWKQIYNLGYLKSYTIKEIAETVKQVAKDYHIDVEIKKEPSDAILYAELDSTKLYQDTKWQPQYNMEQIVRSIFEEKIKKL